MPVTSDGEIRAALKRIEQSGKQETGRRRRQCSETYADARDRRLDGSTMA
jgi:hypothetical protein